MTTTQADPLREALKAAAGEMEAHARGLRCVATPMTTREFSLELDHLATALRALAQSTAPQGEGMRLDIDAAVKAGLATRNPAPDAAPSAYDGTTRTVTLGAATPIPSDRAGREEEIARGVLDQLRVLSQYDEEGRIEVIAAALRQSASAGIERAAPLAKDGGE